MTTLEASFIFEGSWGSNKNWLKLKIDPTLANLPKSEKNYAVLQCRNRQKNAFDLNSHFKKLMDFPFNFNDFEESLSSEKN